MTYRLLCLIACLTLCACIACIHEDCAGSAAAVPRPAEAERPVSLAARTGPAAPLRLGAERLFDPEYFPLIAGKRIAIMANQTSLATVDRLLVEKAVNLAAIFAPEHGFWGTAPGGAALRDGDYRGCPVYSRYGGGDDSRRIPAELLAGVDALLFEVQDIGTRHYTFISSMYLAMDSAADAGVAFVVLDRPVAVNGTAVEAPVLEPELQTFVGVGRLPNRYAMTTGELALLFKHEAALMDGPRYPRKRAGDAYWNVADLKLFVVPMSGYDRRRFADEQAGARRWVPPSPNIPSVDSALCYVGAGLFDGNTIAEMVGGYEQFVFIAAPFAETRSELEEFIAAARTHYDFPGVALEPCTDFRTGRPNLVKFVVTDRARFNPSYAAIALLYTQARLYPGKPFFSSAAGRRSFAMIHGNEWLANMLAEPAALPPFADIIRRLEKEAEGFKAVRNNYLFYQ